MTRPTVTCTCGRTLTATTAAPNANHAVVWAYVRPHRAPDGTPCPHDSVVLATRLRGRRVVRMEG